VPGPGEALPDTFSRAGVEGAGFCGALILPKTVVDVGVRHSPRAEDLAILQKAWRTPLGDAQGTNPWRKGSRPLVPVGGRCVAHSREALHGSGLPFCKSSHPGFFVCARCGGTLRFEELPEWGSGGFESVLTESQEDILIRHSWDRNHYEPDD